MTKPQDIVVPAFESALDWLSLTAPENSEAAHELAHWCDAQQEIESRTGAQLIEVSPQGYKGRRCGSIFYGLGRYGWLFQISGIKSNEALAITRGLPNEFRCTRTDYRTDQRFNEADAGFSDRMRRIIRGFESGTGAEKNVAIVHHEDFNSGCSLLVGSRSSGSYLRIYDKTAESRKPELGNIWRFELETKKLVANRTWDKLRLCDDVPAMCRSVVAKKMQHHGLPVFWDVERPDIQLATQERETTDERRVRWFVSQVLPTMAKVQDVGLRQQVEDAFERCFIAPSS